MEKSALRMRLSMRLGASIVATLGSLAVSADGSSAAVGELERVADIRPGAFGSSPVGTVPLGHTVVFRAANADTGDEAWVSDGTEAGTIPLEANPGPPSSGAGSFTVSGGQVFFSAFESGGGDELWATDGTVSGTRRVLDINPGGDSSPRSLIAVGNGIVFRANDGMVGSEPWRSDGTIAGTSRIADVNPGPPSGATGFFFPEVLGDEVLFLGVEPVAGAELWRLPVSGTGADLVANINLGGSSDPLELARAGSDMLFTADDGIVGRELWSSDGQPGGDFHLVDNFDSAATDSGVTFLTTFGNHVYFAVAGDTNGVELWRADASGAEIVDDVNPVGNSSPQDLTVVGDWLYFTAVTGAGRELWRTDGDPSGTTEMVADINPAGSSACNFPDFTRVGGQIYFCATDGTSGRELWRTDGTPAGTARVADLNPGPVGSDPTSLTALGDTLYLSASDGSTGTELWALDTARPDTQVVDGPGTGEHVADATPALQLSSAAIDVNRFECAADGGAFASCAGRDGAGQPAKLKEGKHALAVRAVDVRDNEDLSPEELSFVVDTKAPKIAIKGASAEGSAVRLKLKCKRSELSGPCRGKLKLRSAKPGVTLGKKKFKLKPGKAKRLAVKVKGGTADLGSVAVKGKVRDRIGNKGKFKQRKLRIRG